MLNNRHYYFNLLFLMAVCCCDSLDLSGPWKLSQPRKEASRIEGQMAGEAEYPSTDRMLPVIRRFQYFRVSLCL